MPTTIDAHQHFWTFEQANYQWIEDWMTPLRRDIAPSDLAPELEKAGVSGTVAVEARGHIEESDNLLRIADETDFVKGVVGWLPIASAEFEPILEKYAQHPKLVGLRHAISAEPDSGYMDRPDFNQGIALLKRHRLTFDLSFYPPQLPICLDFVDRHPDQVFVVDHLAKPYIRDKKLEPWATHLRELAKRPNVHAKLSGLATESDMENWIHEDLRPYIETALEAFTPARLLFGSDWPVCLLATGYLRWKETIDAYLSTLSRSEQERIYSGTACEAYALRLTPPET